MKLTENWVDGVSVR